MKIERYAFGRITIGGRVFTTDVIILPDRVLSPWWRREGHRLSVDDLPEAIAANPEIILIGTGYYASMKVPAEVMKTLTKRGIDVRVMTTADAAEAFNGLQPDRHVVACLHLSC